MYAGIVRVQKRICKGAPYLLAVCACDGGSTNLVEPKEITLRKDGRNSHSCCRGESRQWSIGSIVRLKHWNSDRPSEVNRKRYLLMGRLLITNPRLHRAANPIERSG